MSYIDGYVLAVPTANRQAYRDMATLFDPIFMEHGALQVIEAWGDDVPDGVHTGFPMVVQKGEDEPVVFSIIVWPDKATRDAGQSAFMTDERVTGWDHNQAPFDGKRMIFGGFETLFSA
ncbi:MAG: DUF1428 domain-containing protein [Hyphomonadaceae bacterium]|nr:DUF1428 domain-containing protein [Hyphomonadaceae bacterium]